jgi:internalin A
MSRPKKTRPAAARPAPAQEPEVAPLDFLDPADNRTLLGYFRDLGQWHGYIKFLEPGRLRDNPDMPIHKLYVEPFVTKSHIHTDTPPEQWLPESQPVLQAVTENRRLVLLGDPGSGKSTLVSWITWQLSFPGSTPWQQTLGPLVPFPMVLRELKLDANVTWQGLLYAFLSHPVAEKLRAYPQLVRDLLALGQAFLMLDGLDEIGDPGKAPSSILVAAFSPRLAWWATATKPAHQTPIAAETIQSTFSPDPKHAPK